MRVSGDTPLRVPDAKMGMDYKTMVDTSGKQYPQCMAVCVRGKCTITSEHLGTCCHTGGKMMTSQCWMGGKPSHSCDADSY
jgi:hypothetical protein